MKYRTRIYYTEEQKALMWDRWQAGDSLREIAAPILLSNGALPPVFMPADADVVRRQCPGTAFAITVR